MGIPYIVYMYNIYTRTHYYKLTGLLCFHVTYVRWARRASVPTMQKGRRLVGASLRRSKKASGGSDKAEWTWTLLGRPGEEERRVPGDVPRGHVVVYVGKEHKRFIINLAFLEHPLFRLLLDQAQEEYEFQPNSKLCMPCDEDDFVAMLNYVISDKKPRLWTCC